MSINLSEYIFTYSANAQMQEKALADRLFDFLSENYGLSHYRNDSDGFTEGVAEILFGHCRHNDSIYTNKLIREKRFNHGRDFCIRFKLGKLIINAVSIEALEEAVEYFISLCDSCGLNVPTDYSYYRTDNYTDWSPADISISHYILVTPRAASYIYKREVEGLREAIRIETGAQLPLLNDRMPQRRLEIQIGNTNRNITSNLTENEYEIGLNGECLYIKGGSDLSTAAAIRKLNELLRAGERPDLNNPLRGVYIPLDNDYRLVFKDDFDGKDLDNAVWSKRERENVAHDGGFCYRTNSPKNVSIEDGKLVIKGNRKGERDFESGYVWTKDKLLFQYGIIEICAKLPHGAGLWPGFWLNSEDLGYNVAPEIDIMEMFGTNLQTGFSDTIYCAMHRWASPEYGGNTSVDMSHDRNKVTLPMGEELSDDWHTIGMEWTPKKMIFTFDGSPYFEADITDKENECFHKPVFIILSMAVGLSLIAPPNESNEWPAVYEIDRIHLYQHPEIGILKATGNISLK